jgi:hypothetical protein
MMIFDRYPENSQGDFYVGNEVCIACGAPEAEAPDLIEHSKFKYGHCYFKKQPETEDEIERAINAIAASCISGLRYGGTDEKILKRIYEIGEGEQCDHRPIGSYKTVIWNNVTFMFNGSLEELSKLITTEFIKIQTYLNKRIINFKLIGSKHFEFIFRWTDGSTGNIFKCLNEGDNLFRLEIETEKKAYEISIRPAAIALNSIFISDNRFSKVLWFDKDKNTYNKTELR